VFVETGAGDAVAGDGIYDGGLLYTGYRYRDCGTSSWYHGVHVQGAEPIESAGPGVGYVAGWTIFPVDTRDVGIRSSKPVLHQRRPASSSVQVPVQVESSTAGTFGWPWRRSVGTATLQRDGLLVRNGGDRFLDW
jgi:hypothetical protein